MPPKSAALLIASSAVRACLAADVDLSGQGIDIAPGNQVTPQCDLGERRTPEAIIRRTHPSCRWFAIICVRHSHRTGQPPLLRFSQLS